MRFRVPAGLRHNAPDPTSQLRTPLRSFSSPRDGGTSTDNPGAAQLPDGVRAAIDETVARLTRGATSPLSAELLTRRLYGVARLIAAPTATADEDGSVSTPGGAG